MNQRELEYKKTWSLTIRIWHWLLVVSVVTGWLLGEFRTFSVMQWHIYFGYMTGVLLLLRCVLGVASAGPTAFRSIWASIPNLGTYLPKLFVRRPSGVPGHNPIGAIAVFVILLVLGVQVITGLFAEDDALFYEGPLVGWASDGLVRTMTSYHHIVARAVLIVVALHVAAIFFYLIWKKENLIKAMITGWKQVVK